MLNHRDDNINKENYTPVSFQKRVYQRCEEVFRLAESLYPIKFTNSKIVFDGTHTWAGQAEVVISNDPKNPYILELRLNPKYNHEGILKEAIPHEIAHLVCLYFGWDKAHGRKWVEVARSLGSTGEKFYHYGPPPRNLREGLLNTPEKTGYIVISQWRTMKKYKRVILFEQTSTMWTILAFLRLSTRAKIK